MKPHYQTRFFSSGWLPDKKKFQIAGHLANFDFDSFSISLH